MIILETRRLGRWANLPRRFEHAPPIFLTPPTGNIWVKVAFAKEVDGCDAAHHFGGLDGQSARRPPAGAATASRMLHRRGPLPRPAC